MSRWRRLAALALAAAGLLVGACAVESEPATEARRSAPVAADLASSAGASRGSARPVVDRALLAFLSRARAAHHRADLLEEATDKGQAIEVLEDFVASPARPDPVTSPEVREVLADAHARLADLRSQRGDREAALADVAKGLRYVPEASYYRGHLFEVRGLVEERASQRLRASGRVERARQARRRALDAFEAAMKIQAEVIRDSVPVRGDAEAGAEPFAAPPSAAAASAAAGAGASARDASAARAGLTAPSASAFGTRSIPTQRDASNSERGLGASSRPGSAERGARRPARPKPVPRARPRSRATPEGVAPGASAPF